MKIIIGVFTLVLILPSSAFSKIKLTEKNILGLWKTIKTKQCSDAVLKAVAIEENIKLTKKQFQMHRKMMGAMQIEYKFKSRNRGEARVKMLQSLDSDRMVVTKNKFRYALDNGRLKLYLPRKRDAPQDTFKIIKVTKDEILIVDGPCRFSLKKISRFSFN